MVTGHHSPGHRFFPSGVDASPVVCRLCSVHNPALQLGHLRAAGSRLWGRLGYDGGMSEPENERNPDQQGEADARRDLAEHEQPETGLISDEELPQDLRPTDDNPLAKDPDDSEESSGPRLTPDKPETVGDPGNPGAPA